MDAMEIGYGDPVGVVMLAITREVSVPDFVKEASADGSRFKSLPASAFGDPSSRMFPLDTAADAWLSREYFKRVAPSMQGWKADVVGGRIEKAAQLWGLADIEPVEVKASSEVSHIVKGEDPSGDSVEMSLTDPVHYKDAAEWLVSNKANMTYPMRKSFARALLSAPEELHTDLPDHTERYLEKAAGVAMSTKPVVIKAIMSRVAQVARKAPDISSMLVKTARAVKEVDLTPGTLSKVAAQLDLVDRAMGLERWYGGGWGTPEEDVYAIMAKDASAMIDDAVKLMNGHIVHASELVSKRAGVDEFFENLTGEVPYEDDEEMLQFVKTIPRNDANALVDSLELTAQPAT